VYKVDFEAERKSREELNDERLKLQEKLIATEEELKLARQMAEMQLRDRYAPGRRSGGLAGETQVFQQQLIAQEQSATQGSAATAAAAATATPAATAAPVETQPAARPTVEVCSTAAVHMSLFETVCLHSS